MIITCEGCESSFHVDEKLIKPSGSKVRCSKCRHIFTARPPLEEAEPIEPLNLTEEVPAAEPGAAAPDTRDIDMRLDALFADSELALNESAAEVPPPAPAGEAGSLAAALDDPGAPAAEALSDDLDLELDLNGALDLPGKDAPLPPLTAAGDDIPESELLASLKLDPEELSLDPVPEPVAAADAGDDELSLDEIELNLSELDASVPASAKEASETVPTDEELELDLDLDSLSLESSPADSTEALATEISSADEAADLDEAAAAVAAALDEPALSLDQPAASPAASAAPAPAGSSGIDELDLSDLEDMLEGASASAVKAAEPTLEKEVDFELDLGAEIAADTPKTTRPEDLDLTAITGDIESAGNASAEPAAGQEEELKLDFDLDADEASESPAEPALASTDDALDFSDMAGILEKNEPPVAEEVREKTDLDLMLEDEPLFTPQAESAEEPSSAQKDLLVEIEALLKEDSDAGPVAGALEPAETDLEIELTDDTIADPAATAKQTDRAAAATALTAAGAVTDELATDEFTSTDFGGATNVLEPETAGAGLSEAVAAEPRRRSRKPLWAVLGVLLLGLITLGILGVTGVEVPFLSDLDIEVPGIGRLFKSEPADPVGNLKIVPLAERISAEFVENAAAGRLCVVRGEVRNTYDHPRSSIRVTAKLYTQDKMVAKTSTVFAGNLLTQEELASLDLISINSRFNLKTGANNINMGVKPGAAVPFMAVFSNLPPNLDEYSVEVSGSLQ